ncbi:MAG: hypothetical protein FWE11_05985 [Defluviitaleaceae bacterium]|nr:hypothetical protein [Defluviitaleaceae bacterium]
MEIKDALKSNLKGEALTNALDFVDYLIARGLSPNMEWENGCRFVINEKSPCLVVFNMQDDGEWFICDVPVVSEPEWNSLSNDLKELIIANIKICSVHKGEPCGCGSEPGASKNIFGKDYSNVCISEIQFHNPTPDILSKLKEIVEWWTVNVGV